MEEIKEFWQAGVLPVKDGLYFANNQAKEITVSYYPEPHIIRGNDFSFIDFITANQDNITEIDITKQIILNNNSGYLCIGEGSFGSEGFFALLDIEKALQWVFYSEESNPYKNAYEIGDGKIVIESTASFSLIVDIFFPEMLELISHPIQIFEEI